MSDKIDNYKIYEFDFGNPFKKFASYCLYIFGCLCTFFWITFGDMLILYRLMEYTDNKIFLQIAAYLFLFIILAAFIFTIILFCQPRKIILAEYGIYVQRNFFPHPYHINRGFNDYIMYSEIESCDFNDTFHWYYRTYMDPPMIFFNYNNVVRIKDKNGRVYEFPVTNIVDFVCDIDERMQLVQKQRS